jgi:hypothetical protein
VWFCENPGFAVQCAAAREDGWWDCITVATKELVEDIGCFGKSLNTTKSIFLNVAWLLVKPLALSESFDC